MKYLVKIALCGALILPSLAQASEDAPQAIAQPSQASAAKIDFGNRPIIIDKIEIKFNDIQDLKFIVAKIGSLIGADTTDEEFALISNLSIKKLILFSPNITLNGYKNIERLAKKLNALHISYNEENALSEEIITYLKSLPRFESVFDDMPGTWHNLTFIFNDK